MAILLGTEVLALAGGVIARYFFNNPFIWLDEFASALFIWLAMIGAVIGLQQSRHMRMTALLRFVRPPLARFLQTVCTLLTLTFLVALAVPAFQYVALQRSVDLSTLGISSAYRSAAFPSAIVLMALSSLIQLFHRLRYRDLALGVLLVVGMASALFALGPAFTHFGNWTLMIFFVFLIAVLVCIGLPIAFCFGLSTLSYLYFASPLPPLVFVNRMDEGMSSSLLLAIPMFVFLGHLITRSGLAGALVEFLGLFVGRVRGGLYYVLLGGMYIVSGISGSKAADMAAIAPAVFPEMEKRGSHAGELLAVLASSAAMAETIPPSIILIVVGSATSISIGALFVSGLLPALVCALSLVLVIAFRCRKEPAAQGVRLSWKTALSSLSHALPALILLVVIRAAVIRGIATPTEVGTVGIAYIILYAALFVRRFPWKALYPALVQTCVLTGVVLLIVGTATAMAWSLTISGFSSQLVAFMQAIAGGRFGFLLASVVLFAVLGCVLEGLPVLVLFGPLMFPIARGMGINEVHYAMVVIIAMGIGLHSPPIGVGYYTACAIAKVDPDSAMKRMWPYLGALLLALLAIAAIPWISTLSLQP